MCPEGIVVRSALLVLLLVLVEGNDVFRVQNCSFLFDGYYICNEKNICANVNRKSSLVAVHKFLSNSVKKVWYIQDNEGVNIYGAIEVSANPWSTEVWRKVKSTVVPSMRVEKVDLKPCQILGEVEIKTGINNLNDMSRLLWLSIFSHSNQKETIEYYNLFMNNTSICAMVLLRAVKESLVAEKIPSLGVMTVSCHWIYMSLGWSIQSKKCYRYIASSLRGTASKHEIAEMLTMISEVERFSSTAREGEKQSEDADAIFQQDGVNISIQQHYSLLLDSECNEEFNVLLGPIACIDHDRAEECIVLWSMYQFATLLLKHEFEVREALLVLSTLEKSENVNLNMHHQNRDLFCFRIVLELLSGDVDHQQTAKIFNDFNCGYTCKSIADGSFSANSLDVYHSNLVWSSASDSLSLVCHHLCQPDTIGNVESSISIANSFFVIGAIEAACHISRYVFQDIADSHSHLFLPCTDDVQAFSGMRGIGNMLYDQNTFLDDTPRSLLLESMVRVEDAHWQRIRSSPQLLSFFVSAVLQVHLTEYIPSLKVSTVSKRIASRELLILSEQCRIAQDCSVNLDMLSPAVRALFLIAYVDEDPMETSVHRGHTIPFNFHRVLNISGAIPSAVVSSETNPFYKPTSATDSKAPAIRVAFLSAYFFRHSVGRLLGNMILSLSLKDFNVSILSYRRSDPRGDKKADDLTMKLKKRVHLWVDLSHNVARDAASVRDLAFDILVFGDLLMDPDTAFLTSQRLATVQMGFWGHPFTSGSPAIDFFISSDGFQEPWSIAKQLEEQSAGFFEQVVLMESYSANFLTGQEQEAADGGMHFHDQKSRIDFLNFVKEKGFDLFNRPFQFVWSKSSAAHNRQWHIYTCLQSLMNMHPLFDEVIVDLLLKDQNALIVLIKSAKAKFIAQEKFQNRLLQALIEADADPNRVVLLRQVTPAMYSRIVCGGDVTLDPFPFGGGVTLSDSIRCNVPFITSGPLQRVQRLGHGMAARLNVPVMTADNVSAYTSQAVAMAAEVSLCRQQEQSGMSEYSACGRINTNGSTLATSSCALKNALCRKKAVFFQTGDIDRGGEAGERNDVTIEWENLFRRIHKSLRI